MNYIILDIKGGNRVLLNFHSCKPRATIQTSSLALNTITKFNPKYFQRGISSIVENILAINYNNS